MVKPPPDEPEMILCRMKAFQNLDNIVDAVEERLAVFKFCETEQPAPSKFSERR